MLHKCANRPCTNLFRKIIEGRLFQFSRPVVQPASKGRSSGRVMEYFWLCNRCLSTLTLAFDPVLGVHAVPAVAATTAEGFLPGSPDLAHRRVPTGEQR
jgi:hypothetical protein